LFSSFVERVDVFEDYVTIVLKAFDMINIRVCNGSGAIKKEPPLDLHQMVVCNGGAEGNRLHFLPMREKIIVWLRQAVASGAHPHRIYLSIPSS
jgi:hypothetical protein